MWSAIVEALDRGSQHSTEGHNRALMTSDAKPLRTRTGKTTPVHYELVSSYWFSPWEFTVATMNFIVGTVNYQDDRSRAACARALRTWLQGSTTPWRPYSRSGAQISCRDNFRILLRGFSPSPGQPSQADRRRAVTVRRRHTVRAPGPRVLRS